MLVVDHDRSERGPQRRKTGSGRPLHCCCICGVLAAWGDGWSTYCSIKDIDDSAPIPKFCSEPCRAKGGTEAANITDEMKRVAMDAGWRPPEVSYREATAREKYDAAAYEQRRHREQKPSATCTEEGHDET